MKNFFLRNTVFALVALCFSALAHAEVVWIDVRSAIEHKIDNIEGDIRIPHDEIVQQLTTRFPDKDTEIHLYCRSGGRAGKAMAALQEAGYRAVENAGGIADARKQRGLVE